MTMGDSMGAAAALSFCHLADSCLAFTPQVDVRGYSALKRLDFKEQDKIELKNRIIANVKAKGTAVEIHYGGEREMLKTTKRQTKNTQKHLLTFSTNPLTHHYRILC